jgi:hypothetical protein
MRVVIARAMKAPTWSAMDTMTEDGLMFVALACARVRGVERLSTGSPR